MIERRTLFESGVESGSGRDLGSARQVHLVGIAGSGLSGLARLLASRGATVSGSESLDSPTLEKLRREGIRCSVGQAEENVPSTADLVVISAAIGEENPELKCARRRGVPVLKYAQCVGKLMSERTGIAIAGTHGKTTTAAMVASVLAHAGRDPGFIIGGEYPGLGGSSRWGEGELFVAEACEFDRSFLNLNPAYAIVTNIEEDHLDYFQSLSEIQEAFGELVARLPEGGHLVLNGDDPHSRHLSERCRAGVSRFSHRSSASCLSEGEGAADWWAEEIHPLGGGVRFLARGTRGESMRLDLRVPGVHNVKNALGTTALCSCLGLSLDQIRAGLEKFTGVRRRFEILRRDPVVVIDDYAHHPTEIEAVLRAARETFPSRRIRMVFQPHQHSRIRRFLGSFAQVLAAADEVVVAEVFRARDPVEEVRAVNAAALAAEIKRLGGRAVWAPTFAEILAHLKQTLKESEVLICLGAGDITLLARRIADGAFPSPNPRGGGAFPSRSPRAEGW